MKMQILLLVMMLLPMVAGAETVEINGIYYELVSKAKQAEVKQKPSGYYSGNVVIPASVTYEGAEYSVTGIGNNAFRDCSGLTSITIPNSVTILKGGAFYGCSGLTTVTIPNSVTSIEKCYYDGNRYGVFQNCSSLTSVMIPNSVKSIGSYAFSGCSSLISVTIPNSVTSIGSNAFSSCSSLSIITIPNSVTSIGSSAFFGCSGLPSVTIPNSVTSIGKSAFYGCSGLTSVTIGSGVTSIGNYAFSSCSSLISVTIGSGVKNIYRQAFAYCKELTDVYCLAEEVPSAETDAFQDSYIEYATLYVPTASVEAYRAVEPWNSFKSIVALNGEDIQQPEVKKCATPAIAIVDGELTFSCETEGVEYAYEITTADVKKGYSQKVKLSGTYKVTVYATKTGYDNSDVVTLEFKLGTGGDVCDVNKDGAVDVADIATIISEMAAHAREK